MVERRTLTPLVLVRIQVPQPNKINDLAPISLKIHVADTEICRNITY